MIFQRKVHVSLLQFFICNYLTAVQHTTERTLKTEENDIVVNIYFYLGKF